MNRNTKAGWIAGGITAAVFGAVMIASPLAAQATTSGVAVKAVGCGINVKVWSGKTAEAFQVAQGDTQIGLPVAIPAGGIDKTVDLTATGSGTYDVYFNKDGVAVKKLTRVVTVTCGGGESTSAKPSDTATPTVVPTTPKPTETTPVPTTTTTAPTTTPSTTTPVVTTPATTKAAVKTVAAPKVTPSQGDGGVIVP